MSRLREKVELPEEGELSAPGEGDAEPFEVFIQLQRGKPHVHAGTVDAVDGAMAMQFAREHYGRDRGDDSPVAHALPFIAPRRPPGALRSSLRHSRSFLRRKVQSVTDVKWPNKNC